MCVIKQQDLFLCCKYIYIFLQLNPKPRWLLFLHNLHWVKHCPCGPPCDDACQCYAWPCPPCNRRHANITPGPINPAKECTPILHLACLTPQRNACQRSDRPGLPCDRVHANTCLAWSALQQLFYLSLSHKHTQVGEEGGRVIESPWSLNQLIHTLLCESYLWSSFLTFFFLFPSPF